MFGAGINTACCHQGDGTSKDSHHKEFNQLDNFLINSIAKTFVLFAKLAIRGAKVKFCFRCCFVSLTLEDIFDNEFNQSEN